MQQNAPPPQLPARLPERKGSACFRQPEYSKLVAAIEYNQNWDTAELVNTGDTTIASGCLVMPDYGSDLSVVAATEPDTVKIIGHALEDVGANSKGRFAVYGTMGMLKTSGNISAGDYLTNSASGAAVSTGSNISNGTFATALQSASNGTTICAVIFGTHKENIETCGENVGSAATAIEADTYVAVYEGCAAAGLLGEGSQLRVQSMWSVDGISVDDCAGFSKRIVELETVASKNCENVELLDRGIDAALTALDLSLSSTSITATANCTDDGCPTDITGELEWQAGTLAYERQTEDCCYELPEEDDAINEHFTSVYINGVAILLDCKIETFGMCPNPSANVEVVITDMAGKASVAVLINGQIKHCIDCAEINLALGACVQITAKTTNGGNLRRCNASTKC